MDPHLQDTLGAPPHDYLEIIHKNIQEKTEKLHKKAEQGPSFFPDFRLLSAFDAESGTLRMAMLESTKPKGELVTSVAD